MTDLFDELSEKHIQFIELQHLFFVATAGAEGTVNLSPKGMNSLKVVASDTVVWLNHTGSGNETAVHVAENNRMTLMFCSFEKQPLILRIYGQAVSVHPRDPEWQEMTAMFDSFTGTRQFFKLKVELVQKSCGFGVPFYEYQGERNTLIKWAENKGPEGVLDYWKNKNVISLDGKKSDIFE